MHSMQPTALLSAAKISEASTSWNPNLRGHPRIPLRWCLNRFRNPHWEIAESEHSVSENSS